MINVCNIRVNLFEFTLLNFKLVNMYFNFTKLDESLQFIFHYNNSPIYDIERIMKLLSPYNFSLLKFDGFSFSFNNKDVAIILSKSKK